MRLWHYDLIENLPNLQLIALWRELNSIYKKQDKHILINFIYVYPKDDLYTYSVKVLEVLNVKKIRFKLENFKNYFSSAYQIIKKPYRFHMNDKYIMICFFNLYEKYQRGQRDFSDDVYQNLCDKLNSLLVKIPNSEI